MVQKIFTISKIFPLTSLRTLISKIQPLRIKFLFFFESRFPFTTTRTKSLRRWRSGRKSPRKNKKDRDRRQKYGRSLARSLPDSHGQPGYFAVFLNSHPAQLYAPGYFRASYSHSQKLLLLRDMKPLGLFVLP